uniref:GNAT family N-acetyltransferase n=1 Tax=Streptomyces sp. NBC_00008 TaxID=2903610 RepID=A0AAU2W147_9ACTN
MTASSRRTAPRKAGGLRPGREPHPALPARRQEFFHEARPRAHRHGGPAGRDRAPGHPRGRSRRRRGHHRSAVRIRPLGAARHGVVRAVQYPARPSPVPGRRRPRPGRAGTGRVGRLLRARPDPPRPLPAPAYPKGLAARVHALATRPEFRRRGLAREVLSALLDRLQADGVTLFELHASEEAAPLYRDLGFTADPALMRMTRLVGAAARVGPPAGRVLLPPEGYASSVPKSTGSAFIFFTDRDDRPTGAESVFDPCGIPPSAPSLGVDVPQASTRPRRISHAPGTAANSPSAWVGSTNISLTSRSRDRCDLVTAWPRPRPGRGTGRGAVSCGRAVLPPPIR